MAESGHWSFIMKKEKAGLVSGSNKIPFNHRLSVMWGLTGKTVVSLNLGIVKGSSGHLLGWQLFHAPSVYPYSYHLGIWVVQSTGILKSSLSSIGPSENTNPSGWDSAGFPCLGMLWPFMTETVPPFLDFLLLHYSLPESYNWSLPLAKERYRGRLATFPETSFLSHGYNILIRYLWDYGEWSGPWAWSSKWQQMLTLVLVNGSISFED